MNTIIQYLDSIDSQDHGLTEKYLSTEGDELKRLLFQVYVDQHTAGMRQKIVHDVIDRSNVCLQRSRPELYHLLNIVIIAGIAWPVSSVLEGEPKAGSMGMMVIILPGLILASLGGRSVGSALR